MSRSRRFDKLLWNKVIPSSLSWPPTVLARDGPHREKYPQGCFSCFDGGRVKRGALYVGIRSRTEIVWSPKDDKNIQGGY